MPPCWICGSLADSAEHSIKRTDIQRHIGKGTYKAKNRVVRIDEDGKRRFLQSDNASLLKRSHSLCSYCNNTRSQPWDRAYTQLMSWIFSHEGRIRKSRKVDLRLVSQKATGQFARNAYRYVAKAFGCALLESKAPIPVELPGYLNGSRTSIPMYVYFAVFRDLKIGTRLTRAEIHRLEGTGANEFSWGYSLDWLTISLSYGYRGASNLGPGWLGRTTKIKIGAY